MSLKYEPSSEPLQVYVQHLFFTWLSCLLMTPFSNPCT